MRALVSMREPPVVFAAAISAANIVALQDDALG